MNERYSDHLKQYALSIQQFQVLRSLRDLNGEPATMQDLQSQMISKSSNTTRLVEKLRLKGLIDRRQDEVNRRKVEIRITEEGLKLLEEIEVVHSDFENSTVTHLTEDEMETLQTLLIKIRRN